MARTYKRDARGRFAGGGYSGQTGGRGARLTAKGTRKGGGARISAAKPGGTVAKPRGLKPGAVKVAKLRPSQVAGQRRRASETPEKAAQRRLEKVRFREGQLQEKRRQLESSLNRRRGRIEGDQRRKATKELRKTKTSLDRVSGARQQYENTVNRRQNEQNWNLARRSRRQAPANDRTALNRLGTMRRRVGYLRKNEDKSYDKWGGAYDGPGLAKARKDLSAAVAGVRGQRISIRTKSQARGAQVARRNNLINFATRQRAKKAPLYTARFRRGVSRQGNLLTGAVDRMPSRRLKPVRRR